MPDLCREQQYPFAMKTNNTYQYLTRIVFNNYQSQLKSKLAMLQQNTDRPTEKMCRSDLMVMELLGLPIDGSGSVGTPADSIKKEHSDSYGARLTQEQKESLLTKIRDNKASLFNRFNSDLNDETKRNAWSSIWEWAKGNKLPFTNDPSHDYKYLQRCVFNNYVHQLKSKMATRDVNNPNAFSHTDRLMMDILGYASTPKVESMENLFNNSASMVATSSSHLSTLPFSGDIPPLMKKPRVSDGSSSDLIILKRHKYEKNIEMCEHQIASAKMQLQYYRRKLEKLNNDPDLDYLHPNSSPSIEDDLSNKSHEPSPTISRSNGIDKLSAIIQSIKENQRQLQNHNYKVES